jgi:hypothetical protein
MQLSNQAVFYLAIRLAAKVIISLPRRVKLRSQFGVDGMGIGGGYWTEIRNLRLDRLEITELF